MKAIAKATEKLKGNDTKAIATAKAITKAIVKAIMHVSSKAIAR